MDRTNFNSNAPYNGGDLEFEGNARRVDFMGMQTYGFQTGIIGTGLSCSLDIAGGAGVVNITSGAGFIGDIDAGSISASKYYGGYVTYAGGNVAAPIPGDPTSWVLNTPYYIYVQAAETNTISRPAESGALTTIRTATAGTITVGQITAAAYAVLAAEQRHQKLVIAVVRRLGAALVATDITNAFRTSRIKTSGQTVNISGVEITSFTSNTLDGYGTLTYTAAGTSLSWLAPLDGAGVGVGVNIGAGGAFTLESGTTAYKINVFVTVALLPTTNQTDSIVVADLYQSPAHAASGADFLLRSMGGSALKTIANPLGLSVGDLGGSTADISTHRKIQHTVGIQGNASSMTPSIFRSAFGVFDYMTFTGMLGGAAFYVNGTEFTALAGTRRAVGGVPGTPLGFDDLFGVNTSICEVYVDYQGYITKQVRASCGVPAPTITGVVPLDLYLQTDGIGVPKTLQWVPAAAGVDAYFTFDSGPRTYISDTAGDNAMYTVYGPNGVDHIKIWVYATSLGAGASDTWTTVNLSVTDSLGMKVGNVVFYGHELIGVNSIWDDWLQSAVAGAAGAPWDLRSFGTMGVDNLAKSTKDYIADTLSSVISNGVVSGCNAYFDGANTKTTIGSVFLKGKRRDASSVLSITTPLAGTWLLFIKDSNGVLALQLVDSTVAMTDEVYAKLCDEMVPIAKFVFGAPSNLYDLRTKPGLGSATGKYAYPSSAPANTTVNSLQPKFDSGLVIPSDSGDLSDMRIFNITSKNTAGQLLGGWAGQCGATTLAGGYINYAGKTGVVTYSTAARAAVNISATYTHTASTVITENVALAIAGGVGPYILTFSQVPIPGTVRLSVIEPAPSTSYIYVTDAPIDGAWMCKNLIYNYNTNLWSLLDSTRSGYATRLPNNTGGIYGVYTDKAGYYFKTAVSNPSVVLTPYFTFQHEYSTATGSTRAHYFESIKLGYCANGTSESFGFTVQQPDGSPGYIRAKGYNFALGSVDYNFGRIMELVDAQRNVSSAATTLDTNVYWAEGNQMSYFATVNMRLISGTAPPDLEFRGLQRANFGGAVNPVKLLFNRAPTGSYLGVAYVINVNYAVYRVDDSLTA